MTNIYCGGGFRALFQQVFVFSDGHLMESSSI